MSGEGHLLRNYAERSTYGSITYPALSPVRRLGREGVLRHGLCPVASAHDSIHAADQYRHILRTVASALVRSDRKGICSRAGRP